MQVMAAPNVCGGSSTPALKSLLVALSPNWLHEGTRSRHVVAYLVEVLCCKPEGRGLDS
jgi:hypothetical protein